MFALGASPPLLAVDIPLAAKLRITEFGTPVPAPPFELPKLGGGTATLEAFRDRWLLLNFWATWCPPCVAELPALQRLHDTLESSGFSVVALASDREGERVVAPFATELALGFPILMDRRSEVFQVYGARALPSSFIVDPKGRVVAAAKGEREWDAPDMVRYFKALIQPD